MSTVCKLDPIVRQRRTYRANLLRNPPHAMNRFAAGAILAELALIHDNPHLSGDKKHQLFVRGVKQLTELK
jgi:hypothetical protein